MSNHQGLTDSIRQHFTSKSSSELREILDSNDLESWSAEALEAARIVLKDRTEGHEAEPVPPRHRSLVGTVWRDGRDLVVTQSAELPGGCLVCNAHAEHTKVPFRVSFSASKYGRCYYSLFFANLCTKHFRWYRWTGLLSHWCLGVGLLYVLVGYWLPSIGRQGAWLLLLFPASLILHVNGRLLRVKNVTPEGVVRTGGAGRAYLATLPELESSFIEVDDRLEPP